ncbi:MAG: SWIM zinc finger family protein [Bradymonadia bacterium]
MEFTFNYRGASAVNNRADRTEMVFSPDTLRDPTFFRGELTASSRGGGIPFREAISALHDVVVQDGRFVPKDKSAYKAWVAQQEQLDVLDLAAERADIADEIKELRDELRVLDQRSTRRTSEFYAARRRYWDWLYRHDYNAWLIFDPVITVHPDELFFECFSVDESSYGRLGVNHDVFQNLGDMACGTTNVDYSQQLYDEFQKIRSYKTTTFQVDPSGFETQTHDATTFSEAHKEVKIDLPDTWVRGFLQVNSAMSLPATTFTLHPMDVHNFCFVLRRHKEIVGPRSMRYVLTPGQPVKVVFEPWDFEVVCPRSIYEGPVAQEIRVWGRRRLNVLERLIPVARKFTVHLLGSGMPSFYVADLGDMSFTLGLSGWTTNDWAAAGNFDLMAPRADVDADTKRRVFQALKADWLKTPDVLAHDLNLDRATVLGALGAWTQAGRAIYDLNKGVYRARELSREPLPLDALRFSSPREESAHTFVSQGKVRLNNTSHDNRGWLHLRGTVKDTAARGSSKQYMPSIIIDTDERMNHGECTCNWYTQNKLYKGPCEHMIALRLEYNRRRH